MNYKILMLNFGYARGWDGSWKSFFKTLYRLPFQFFFQRKNELLKLEKIIKKEKPDLILLSEIESKKCLKYLENLGYQFSDMQVKYGPKSFYRKTPAWHNNSNAFLSKEKVEYKIHYFSLGAKKLIYEIKLENGYTIIFAHFSLVDKTRELQFKEILTKFKNIDKKIIAGDFNIKKEGLKELEIFEKNNFKILPTKPTYPSYQPKEIFDIFLLPQNLNGKTKIFYSENMSDHLPVILNIKK